MTEGIEGKILEVDLNNQYFKEIKDFYHAKERKKHKNIAKTLVAQELAKICYNVLATKTGFNNTFKGKTLSR